MFEDYAVELLLMITMIAVCKLFMIVYRTQRKRNE